MISNYKLKDIYSGITRKIFVVTKEDGENVTVKEVGFDGEYECPKDKLSEYKKGDLSAISNYISCFIKDYEYLLVDLTGSISLCNIPIKEFKEKDQAIYKEFKDDRPALIEKLKENRREHVKIIMLSKEPSEEDSLVTNECIIGTEPVIDYIKTLHLHIEAKYIHPEFLCILFLQYENIYNSLRTLVNDGEGG